MSATLHAQHRTDAIALPTLGVIGGMGPLATVDFIKKVVLGTPARCDQEHLPLVVCSIPQIPDRSTAILEDGPSPLPELLRVLTVLERSAVDYIAIPCNTAHFWHGELQAASRIEILHIVDAVVADLQTRGVHAGAVGVLATTGTMHTGIYQRRLAASGYRAIVPRDEDQRVVMSLIRAVKSGAPPEPAALERIIDALEAAGANATVLACTELPLFDLSERTRPVVDSTASLARLCIRRAWQHARAGDG